MGCWGRLDLCLCRLRRLCRLELCLCRLRSYYLHLLRTYSFSPTTGPTLGVCLCLCVSVIWLRRQRGLVLVGRQRAVGVGHGDALALSDGIKSASEVVHGEIITLLPWVSPCI